MKTEITVRVKEGFKVYNHDYTKLLAEIHDGDSHAAEFYKETEEYFAKDREGRTFKVGELNADGNLIIEDEFELVGHL
ncbi:hypothetical protein JQN58_04950 [Aneurinibacillus sp. BA2021]|nr:hypothetical protein [Aneurinibacillus sp. BA2021]